MAIVSYAQALNLSHEAGAIERRAGNGIMSKAAFFENNVLKLDHSTMEDCYRAYRSAFTANTTTKELSI